MGPESSGLETAARVAARVRSGELDPAAPTRTALARIARSDAGIGAFQRVRDEAALAEAASLGDRPDLSRLPLAGVPVAIKDNIDVVGEPTRVGTPASAAEPAAADHECVRRLREAGAVVVGKTRLPEMGIWATTESGFGITRNPWDPERNAGGSSGGSAAAVASGLVPIAHGNDGLGSVRIPAAACGVFGMKPGRGVVPADLGANDWYGLAENGALATTVDDAALMLSVLADRPDWIEPGPPGAPLRIALSTKMPVAGAALEDAWRDATLETAGLLRSAGHTVEERDPPYTTRTAVAGLAYWFSGTDLDARRLGPDVRSRLAPRAQRHAKLGVAARSLGLTRIGHREAWRRRVARFFGEFDLLLTPALATAPPAAEPRHEKGWWANLLTDIAFAPFAGAWNVAGVPAAAVPAGRAPDGMPLSVQIVGAVGSEATVLAVAKQLEQLRPWPRHAPMAGA